MKQVVVDVRGKAYQSEDATPSGDSVPAMKGEAMSLVGFRLVHDDADLPLRGGGWYYGPQDARVAPRLSFDPARRGDSLGFRLAVDWREA